MRGLESVTKALAKRMAGGDDVTSDIEELNKRKEDVMAGGTSAMVTRKKSLRRPRRHYAKATAGRRRTQRLCRGIRRKCFGCAGWK